MLLTYQISVIRPCNVLNLVTFLHSNTSDGKASNQRASVPRAWFWLRCCWPRVSRNRSNLCNSGQPSD